ncbi:MAG: hypothetical protein GX606_07430 [Elusimicrobia bacterium]|nr:hypothetical protein [Elusimicrobiota bacterium]
MQVPVDADLLGRYLRVTIRRKRAWSSASLPKRSSTAPLKGSGTRARWALRVLRTARA